MTTATHPIPQDLLNEIADLIEQVKRLDPQIEEFARRIAKVSNRLHEFPAMTGEHTDGQWNVELEEEIGDSELRRRASVLIDRLMAATGGSLGPRGLEEVRDRYGVGGFGIDHEDPDRE